MILLDYLTTSVVLATYNGEKYILEQLNSLLMQTHKIDEVLIADDCSTDNTVNIINQFIESNNLFPKWKLNINKKNKGYKRNFYDLSLKATGDIIYFCDQDDVWSKSKVEKTINVFHKHPSINVLCTDMDFISNGENPLIWSKKYVQEMRNDEQVEFVKFNSQTFFCQRSGCVMCVKNDFFKEISPFWNEEWAQDDFVWKFATITNSCAILHFKAIKRRLHENNTTFIKLRTREHRLNQIESQETFYNSIEEFIKNNQLFNNEGIQKILLKNQKSLEIRYSMIKYHNIFKWLSLALLYRDCYPWNKALFLDLYFIFSKEYKQGGE